MIVGATETPDVDVLKTASDLYSQQKLRRVYYSAYSPIPHADARLPGQSPPLIREHRLYQADWLMRFYGFQADEIVAEKDRNLSLDIDPKLAWALANRHFFPVDVNRASYEELLRIPGVGVRSVKRILSIRKHRNLRAADLRKLRVAWNRTKAFVLTADHNPSVHDLDRLDLKSKVTTKNEQLMLFDAAGSAVTGEV
ncbi:radical sam domain-containing protein [Rhodopirellula sallentina SM41]|uniref:Radical sam domain-containing protein n=2 Tax=Rhodopirellula TaxID=265488 RepID=M5TST9_9BACT|nr:radical sam domain-containing protein [Rhodopirellula sallentina SM41]